MKEYAHTAGFHAQSSFLINAYKLKQAGKISHTNDAPYGDQSSVDECVNCITI